MYSYRYLLMLDVKRCLLTAVMLVIGIPCVTMEIRYRWAWDYVLIAVPLLLFLVSVFFYYVRRLVLFAVDFISGEQNERMCYKKHVWSRTKQRLFMGIRLLYLSLTSTITKRKTGYIVKLYWDQRGKKKPLSFGVLHQVQNW